MQSFRLSVRGSFLWTRTRPDSSDRIKLSFAENRTSMMLSTYLWSLPG